MIQHIDHRKLAWLLASFHVLIIAVSNYLVQFPVNVFGYTTTWGTFSFPFIFLATDLTVRLFGAGMGRRIIFYAMLPALVISYIFTTAFRDGQWLGFSSLTSFDLFVFRIAVASFSAYIVGQLLDVFVFNKLRQHRQWWHAPVASGIFGSFMDTLTFYVIAFYKTTDEFMAANWREIGLVDYSFKIFVEILFFLPLYKIILDMVVSKIKERMI